MSAIGDLDQLTDDGLWERGAAEESLIRNTQELVCSKHTGATPLLREHGGVPTQQVERPAAAVGMWDGRLNHDFCRQSL